MHSSNSVKYLILIISIILSNVSCNCKAQDIVHADFCDEFSIIKYKGKNDGDPEKIYLDKSIYFIFREQGDDISQIKKINNYLNNDEFVQREINNGYYRLRIAFYKSSDMLTEMLEKRSSKYLQYCEDYLLVEYYWNQGKASDTLHYIQGRLKGSHKIILNNVGR